MTPESLRIILKRGIVPCDGGFKFSRDLRHKAISLYGLTDDICFEFARNIKCPHLLIKVSHKCRLYIFLQFNFYQATDSPKYESDDTNNAILDIYQKNEQFELVYVDGGHHVHLNNPERIMPSIEQFLNKHS